MRSNQYGIIPLSAPAGTLRLGIQGSLLLTDTTSVRSFTHPGREWTLSYTAEGVGNAGKTNQILLPEAYVKLTHRRIELVIGRRRESIGLVDSSLSSGSHSWSGNSLPLPRIQLGTRGFAPLGRRGTVAISSLFSHGWFANTPFVQGSYLHQFQFMLRIGKPSWPVRFYGGGLKNAQWGGRSDFLSPALAVNGQLPSRLSDFPNVAFAIRTNGANNPRITAYDYVNLYGNHVGHYDFGTELLFKRINLMFYHQHPFEDLTGIVFQNFPDGLYGIRLRTSKRSKAVFHLNTLVLEVLSSVYQSGPPSKKSLSFGIAGDNYFNNSQYKEGWIYRDRVIGTPFMTRLADAKPAYQIGYVVNNNRVQATHVGLSATIAQQVELVGKFSYSRNRGTYQTPLPGSPTQFSSIVQLGLPVPWLGGCWLTAAVAVDSGQLYENATGGFISLRKTIWQTSHARIPKKPVGFL
ncbi:capsule assembly Wzi family protein [Larkinella knui]